MFHLVPTREHSYSTRNNDIPPLGCGTNTFGNTFFPYTINEWNKLDKKVHQSSSFLAFHNFLIKSIRPSSNSVFGIHDPFGIKLLTRLHIGLSHLGEHKFRHNFQDTINPLCTCSLEIEHTEHFFLCCSNFSAYRVTLLDEIKNIKPSILSFIK